MVSESKIGFIGRMLEKLPEIHISGYNYCGPNTDLITRLARGDIAINKLDNACMDHDFAYSVSTDLKIRCIADEILILKAINRVYARDSQIGERFAAILISGLITVKLCFCKIELFFGSMRKCLSRMLKSENI